MVSKKALSLLFVGVILFFLTGCWDQVAIEERGFVIGVTADLLEEDEDGNYTIGMTKQFVVPAGLGTPGTGGGKQKAFTNISGSGQSLFMISRKIATKTSRPPYYEHLKVIIVSEEIAKEPHLFGEMMDVFIREQEMRRSIKVMIAEGEAHNIIEVEPEEESLPAMYINSVMENAGKSIGIIEPVKTGDIHGYLLNQSSYVLPRVSLEGERVNNNGVAVFQGYDNHMVGMLTGTETKGLNLIKNKNKGGTIEFEINDKLMLYEIHHTNPTITIDVKDKNNITITVSIQAEGRIGEMFGSKTLLTSKRFAEIEKKINNKIETLSKITIKKAQNELNADIFGFDEMLKQRHYDLWQKIKSDWDHGENLFAKTKIKVESHAIIRSTGAVDKTKNYGKE